MLCQSCYTTAAAGRLSGCVQEPLASPAAHRLGRKDFCGGNGDCAFERFSRASFAIQSDELEPAVDAETARAARHAGGR